MRTNPCTGVCQDRPKDRKRTVWRTMRLPALFTGTFLLAIGSMPAEALQNKILFVDPDGEHVAPFASWQTAAKDIQSAVDVAGPGAEIVIRKGVYTGADKTPVVTVTGPATLRGETGNPEGVVIDGEGMRRGVLVRPAAGDVQVMVANLTVRNGHTSPENHPPSGHNAHGAGIYVDHTAVSDGTFELRNCVLSANANNGPHRHNQGGGLASRGSIGSAFRTRIIKSIFTGNSTANRAGVGGGAAFFNTHLMITDCRFENNRAEGETPDRHGTDRPGVGGGVYVDNAPNGSVIRRSDFIGNTSGGGGYTSGGGLAVDGEKTELIVEHCLFQDNRAKYGSAVSLGRAGGQLILRNCRMLDNDGEVFRRWAETAVCRIEDCIIEGRVWRGGGKNLWVINNDWRETRRDPAFMLDADGAFQPVQTLTDWERRRDEILENIQAVAGALPDRSAFPPPKVRVLQEDRLTDGLRRQLIDFCGDTPDHPRIRAWLFIPDGAGPRPAVLCLHQTNRTIGKDEPAGMDGDPDMFYALELAQQGFVTLAPDFTGYGEYPAVTEFPNEYASATMKGVVDHMRAIDVLTALPEVDPGRIGCIGHSLGGFNTLFVSVFDPRIKAVVSSCGHVNWKPYEDAAGSLRPWANPRAYMPRIDSVYQLDSDRIPFDFHEVVAALAPRPFFVNAPTGDNPFLVDGVRETLTAAEPIYALYDPEPPIKSVHPNVGHSFPPDIREQAYLFLKQHLAAKP